MSDTFLVVGLGNPGPGYAFNRHNVGQMVVDILAKRIGASWKSHKAGAMVAEGRFGFGGDKIILAKSNSYMNTSGRPVAGLMKFYGVDLAHTIVLHDELDIPPHDVRIKVGGGHAGHNGLRDIIAAAGAEFVRVRIGIGRPPGQMEVSDFVLANFGTAEKKELPVTLEISADAVESIIKDGVLNAQQKFHGK
ncbi:MAG: aminoacyl-tRNA hydrolase [Actinomycetales bacterium]|nr:aminoacyl-tRNA hydrolase [Actinomycetales bacterium]